MTERIYSMSCRFAKASSVLTFPGLPMECSSYVQAVETVKKWPGIFTGSKIDEGTSRSPSVLCPVGFFIFAWFAPTSILETGLSV